MQILKQSTAIEVKLGPFLDDTDGKTAETGLTITAAEVLLAKNAGDWTLKTEATALAHESNGWYRCLLDATDTNTLGMLGLQIAESGALPVWEWFAVVTANVYDTLFGADLFQVDLTQILGVGQSATDLKDFADDGYDPSTNKVQGVVLTDTVTTLTGHTAQTGDSFARIGATGSGLTSLATQASVNTVDDLIDTEVATIITDIAAVKVDTAAILVDTGTTLDTAIADLPTNAELATSQAAADDATLAAIATILTTAMTESYAADGATMTMAQFAYQIWALLAEASVTTTTLTARKLDGTTAAATFTLNDATTPTSITRAT